MPDNDAQAPDRSRQETESLIKQAQEAVEVARSELHRANNPLEKAAAAERLKQLVAVLTELTIGNHPLPTLTELQKPVASKRGSDTTDSG